MPAILQFLKSDPNMLGRGPGVYYRRASKFKGRQYPKGYFSKYSEHRDMMIKAKGYEKHKIGIPAKAKTKHTTDGLIRW